MYERLTIDSSQMNGEPCIRHLRIPQATILTMLAQGMTIDMILDYYPELAKEDISEAINFAAEAVREKELPLKNTG